MRTTSRASACALAASLALHACANDTIDPSAVSSRDLSDKLLTPTAPGSSTPGVRQSALAFAFPGAGTSGAAAPLSAALGPESITECNPTPSANASPGASVQTVCFFSADEPAVPAATIEQIVEIVGTNEWVHIRLTLNPDFVDNTYGETAIGWGGEATSASPTPAVEDLDAGAPPAPAETDAAAAPAAPGDAPAAPGARPAGPGARPAGPGGADTPAPPGNDPARPAPQAGPGGRRAPEPGGGPGGGRGKGGHTFKDLLGSDHAQLDLLDATGASTMRFKIDYITATADASSGFASLGVSGGEGSMLDGDPAWVLAATTSIDRNLNACGLGSFTENSPETDEAYTPNPNAQQWDYRVSYEIWVSTAAFGSAGFGSALIENVHASPSKAPGDTVDVVPAPCPADPTQPDVVPAPIPAVLEIR